MEERAKTAAEIALRVGNYLTVETVRAVATI
jgi:hypothetical protein